MDYKDRKNFNNPLIMTASASGLVFALSGLVIVILRLAHGRYMNDLMMLAGRTRKKGEEKKGPANSG